MRKLIVFFALSSIVLVTFCIACQSGSKEEKAADKVMTNTDMVKRGDYLVASMGCDDCHSPKKMGAHGPEIIPETRLSGYPSTRPIMKVDTNIVKTGCAIMGPDLTSSAGPWGMSFSANLTSSETGIGTWTEAQFIKAIREGVTKGLDGSRPILPPMPWPSYRNLADDDLKAIYAYLKSTPPVNNVVPNPKRLSELK